MLVHAPLRHGSRRDTSPTGRGKPWSRISPASPLGKLSSVSETEEVSPRLPLRGSCRAPARLRGRVSSPGPLRQASSAAGVSCLRARQVRCFPACKLPGRVRYLCYPNESPQLSLGAFIWIRQRPTLPGRLQPSTIGAERLNFCVRDGNRWIPFAIVTGMPLKGG